MGTLSIPPSTLNLLFPEFFAEKAMFGGYSSPCSRPKVKHNKLLNSIVASTIFYLVYDKAIEIRPSQYGKKLSQISLALIKLRDFNYREYGYLSYKIARLPVNGWMYLFNMIVENVKVDNPDRYMIDRITHHDLIPLKSLWHGKKINCSKVMIFKTQAEWLHNLLVNYHRAYPSYFNIIDKEVDRALGFMFKEIEIYD